MKTNFQRLKISGKDFSFLIKAVVEKGASVKFKVTGKSMFPNILNKDILTLVPYKNTSPEVGDVVAIHVSANNQVFIHRIIKKMNGVFLLKGDNAFKSDGFFSGKSIVGYICNIERDHRQIQVNSFKNKRNTLLSKLRFFCLSKCLPWSFF